MDKRLTLCLDDALISRAKRYARRHGKSVSRLVADLFASLEAEPTVPDELPPTVRRLVGVLAGGEVDEHDYRRYLVEKYLSGPAGR